MTSTTARPARDQNAIMRKAAGTRSRTGGMRWGRTIEAPEPGGPAKVCAELLGRRIWDGERLTPSTAAVRRPG
ncbi:hypothetical protein LO771_28400 [Streptacidiphilus sp. ASG 303]|uniref:hypothetical protein n=1 Tax=Streptacidiphilus sp. ASG 303 TaxID=2896847 RepID=UPI001E4731D6|nr:hypothetical protein [Streptacidiphilus sp. ASG 303]MCD0486200.1 hypothetical protein [Streptacidiphilus sp. ASG 303]